VSFLEMVREFHERFEFPVGQRLGAYPDRERWYADKVLRHVASLLKVSQQELDETSREDLRAVRVRLMVEELRELVEALREKDEVAVADGVADLCYVVVGTAVAFGLPLDELMAEVHRSNMSKTPDGQLKPAKGPNFSPPNLKAILLERSKP
jgi:predicted HAD superfamily Cof-like phosphohydrolase